MDFNNVKIGDVFYSIGINRISKSLKTSTIKIIGLNNIPKMNNTLPWIEIEETTNTGEETRYYSILGRDLINSNWLPKEEAIAAFKKECADDIEKLNDEITSIKQVVEYITIHELWDM